MRYLLIITVLLNVFLACQPTKENRLNTPIDLPYYTDATYTPHWIEEGSESLDTLHAIAPFKFINQNGDTVANADFQGRIYVTNFFFSICPNVCPKMTNNLDLVQQEFLDDDRVKILSHTVMPWVDSVGRLDKYGQMNNINSDQWHLVTGEKHEIYKMARESYFADEGFGKTVTSNEDFLHTENIILVDQQSRIRGIYNGTLKLDIKRMIEDIHVLL